MNNLSVIFCVGIAMGLAKERKAEAALVALLSFLVYLGANNQWLAITGRLVKYKQPSELYGTWTSTGAWFSDNGYGSIFRNNSWYSNRNYT